jgi:hypothetical protein
LRPVLDAEADEAANAVRGRVIRLCGALILLTGIVTVPYYSRVGLTVEWQSTAPSLVGIGVLVGLALYFRAYPGSPRERALGDMTGALALIVLATLVLAPAQYLAVALKRPLIDGWLAAADAALGIHVPSLAEWTRAHPWVSRSLTLTYITLLPQFAVVPLLLGLAFPNRLRLWEFAFHFIVCAAVTVLCLAVIPAECAFLYYGFDSTLNQTRFITHFQGLRQGTFTTIDFRDIEGLISMPSFHAAGAMFCTWAVRGQKTVLAIFILLNTGLLAATFMSGAHYFVDLIASAALFAVSLWMFRRLRKMGGSSATARSRAAESALQRAS